MPRVLPMNGNAAVILISNNNWIVHGCGNGTEMKCLCVGETLGTREINND
ncbi:Uncharacterized protein APZ42_016137 [Daphnia magna]|uniref:Uncharacterized protein n=1 Tax=Daphnia magna TaxID=35525 RepID=A0A162NM43_9CRUS|nr:Uncharacterized protein APZ42_016137 [Daphnia magna]